MQLVSTMMLQKPKLLQEFPNFISYPLFSKEECNNIVHIAESFTKHNGTIGQNGEINTTIRKSNIRWIPLLGNTLWIYEKLSSIVDEANMVYGFSLLGMCEQIQYTTYNEIGHHYSWHMDFGVAELSKRKLSISVQLSDPLLYEGGELQFLNGQYPITAPRELGSAIVFPSFMMHRVCPIIYGQRSSLVIWISGNEPFK